MLVQALGNLGALISIGEHVEATARAYDHGRSIGILRDEYLQFRSGYINIGTVVALAESLLLMGPGLGAGSGAFIEADLFALGIAAIVVVQKFHAVGVDGSIHSIAKPLCKAAVPAHIGKEVAGKLDAVVREGGCLSGGGNAIPDKEASVRDVLLETCAELLKVLLEHVAVIGRNRLRIASVVKIVLVSGKGIVANGTTEKDFYRRTLLV